MSNRDIRNNGSFAKGYHYDYPGKYKPEYCDRIIEYFRQAAESQDFPTMELFATLELGIHDNTMDLWRKKHPEFDNAYRTALQIQQGCLHRGAVRGYFNAQYAKFLSENNYGMKERTEQTIKVELEGADAEGYDV